MLHAKEFNDLLRCYGDMAYRMAFQLTGGRESEARDLVQEVFIKIWRHWAEPRPASMKGWMYRVLHNLYMDALRRHPQSRSVSLNAETGAERWEDILPDPHGSVERSAEQNELHTQVAKALAQLEPDFRIPVILCDMEGLGYDDISRIVGCPVGTVRSRIHRGRLQLRRLLHIEPKEVAL